MTDTNMIRLERALLLLWFMLNLGIGALTVHEYGMSVDEPNNYRYASDTLDAYPSFFGVLYEPYYDSSYDGHGPAFVTLAGIVVRIIQKIFPNVFTTDLWHFSYFITFQLTGLCLYWLTKRWFSKWTAWGILILFGTQPLLLGHSFINPKDIPFMFLFTLAIALGFRLVDSVAANESFISLERPVRTLTNKFQGIAQWRKRKFFIYLAVALAIALALLVFSRQINFLIQQVVMFFFTARPDSWAGRIFGSVASSSLNASAEGYVTKAVRLFDRVERGLLVAGMFFFLAYFGLLISKTTLPAFLGSMWKRQPKFWESFAGLAKSLQNILTLGSLKIRFTDIFRALHNPHVILAGIALGLATGVRAIAPLAGVIVFLYLFTKVRSRAWTMAIGYFLVAGIVTYLVWPHLWDAPIQRYLEGLGMIASFPHHSNRSLFNGRLYADTELPHSYLPILLNIQLTEPLLLSGYIGLGVLGWKILRGRLPTDLLLYTGLGFAFPLLGLILLSSPLYNNFRQALFLIPAMFMLAASALDMVFNKMPQSWTRLLLVVAIAVPGVYSSVKLYPYEYIYYNSLVGGPAGAANRYELDYWRISLREVALQLNEIVPDGSKILVTRGAGFFVRYARPDLVVDKVINNILDPSEGYDYVVQVARWRKWDLYSDSKNVVIIERSGAVLATARVLKNVSVK